MCSQEKVIILASNSSPHCIQMLYAFFPKRKKFFGILCRCNGRTSIMCNDSMTILFCCFIRLTVNGISCFVEDTVFGLRKKITDWSLDERDAIHVTIPFDKRDPLFASWMTYKKCWIKDTDCCFRIGYFGWMQIPRSQDCRTIGNYFDRCNCWEISREGMVDINLPLHLALPPFIKQSRCYLIVLTTKNRVSDGFSKFFEVIFVHKIRFVSKGGGNSLPGEMIGTQFAIKEMIIASISTFFSIELVPVNERTCQSHTLMIVQIARDLELRDGVIDPWWGKCFFFDCWGQEVELADSGFVFLHIAEDLVTTMIVYLHKIFSPQQFFVPWFCLVDGVSHEWEGDDVFGRDDAMRDIGWEFGDATSEIIPCFAIGDCIEWADCGTELVMGKDGERHGIGKG